MLCIFLHTKSIGFCRVLKIRCNGFFDISFINNAFFSILVGFMADDLIKKIQETPLGIYAHEAQHHDLKEFSEQHAGSDFLVSHGPVRTGEEDMMQTQRLAFGTMSGGSLQDILQSMHGEGSVVYEIAWGKIDWESECFRMNKVWVGRSPNVAIQLIHTNVSKTHGYFRRKGSDLLYADIGSTNGSFINGKKVRPLEEMPVESGTILSIGGIKLTFYSLQDVYAVLKV